MQFNVYFDYAAVVLGLILIIFFYPKLVVPDKSNKILRFILVAEVVVAGMDIFTVFQYARPEVYGLPVMYVTNMLYLLLWNMLPFILVMYTRSFLKYEQHTHKQIVIQSIFTAVPYCFAAFIILSSPWTKLGFYFDEQMVYTHGSLHVYLSIQSALYMVFNAFIATKNRKTMGRRRVNAIWFFITMVVTAIVIEIFVEGLMLAHFSAVCSSLIMYLALQSPEDNLDRETGLYNHEALISAISEQVIRKASFSIISVVVDNLKSISTVLGFESYNLFLRRLDEFIEKEFMVPAYLVEDSAVTFFSSSAAETEKMVGAITERFEKSWNLGGVEVNRTCSISTVTYPLVGTDTESLMDAVNYSITELKKLANGSVLRITEAPHSGLKLDDMEKQRLLLEEEAREANLAKEKAEKADREKSMFLANMSHEIRTPMNAILGMTEMILRDDINDRVRQNANDIKGAGDSLLTIINDILDISKVESGKMELVCEDYDVRKLIGDFVTLVSTRIPIPKVDFIVNIAPTIPVKLYGDEVRVRQVFINILNNAAKFTSEGSITLNIDGRHENGKFIIKAEIKDTGCGIRKEDLGKLFDSFARIENSRNKYIEGTGLGLPLCKKLLMLMDGSIEVDSEPGRGTSFKIEIPQDIVGEETIGSVCAERHANILIITSSMEQATSREVKLLCNALDGMEADYRVCCGSRDVEAAMVGRKLTHVFTYRALYEDYADWLHDYCNPEIIIFDEPNIRYEGLQDAIILHEPIYTLNVLRILEGEVKRNKGKREKFTAPEANILVVDDNLMNLKVIEGLLKFFNIKAELVQSGGEAIELAKQKDYDIIFMDHMMPVMDGVEATHHIRNLVGHNAHVPIIALTANVVYGVKNMFIAEGFTEYLAKPVDMKHIASCLLKFLPPEKVIMTEKSEDGENGAEIESVAATISGTEDKPQLAEYPDIPGIVAEIGVSNSGGKIERYKETLSNYYNNGIIQKNQIDKLYENSNYRSLKVEIHTLKVMSSSIGASDMSEFAKEFENALEQPDIDYIKNNYPIFKQSFEKLLEEIYKYVHA